MSFAWASLPIRKDRAIVSKQALIDDRLSRYFENLFLGAVLIPDIVKSEAFRFILLSATRNH